MHRIRELRLNASLSQQALAAKMQVNQTAVSQWERGVTSPNRQTAIRLAELFSVSLDDLMRNQRTDPEWDGALQEGVRIPVLGTVAAGVPLEAVEDVVDYEEIPLAWTRGGRTYFGLKVRGNSMYPKYMDGDTVIVRKQETCENRQDCVVYVNGYDATLKTVILHEDGSLTLQPQNPTYPPTTYEKHNVEELPVLVCGVVVELRRSIL